NGYGIVIQNNTLKNWGGNDSNVDYGHDRAAVLFNYGWCETPCAYKMYGPIVSGNTFQNNRQSDIILMNVDDARIENNTMSVLKCGRNGDQARVAASIFLEVGQYYGMVNNTFRGNTIHDFQSSNNCGLSVTSNYELWAGLWCDTGPSSSTME